jgi:uncharacterized protein YjbI with pentapeptide repeats
MPKTAAKKKPAPTGKLAGKKVAFAGKFGYGNWDRGRMQTIVKLEGGKVVNGEKKEPDLLVAGAGKSGGLPGAATKIQKKYPAVQLVSEADFYQMTTPDAAELEAILRECPHDWSYWRAMAQRLEKTSPRLDLSGRDFRNLNLTQASLEYVNVDGCDFRGAKLNGVDFEKVRGAKFDGTRIDQLNEAEDCSFKAAELLDLFPDRFTRCDFTGAKFRDFYGYNVRLTDCTFHKADLSSSDLTATEFKNCTFSQANLSYAKLYECDLTGTDLSGADLTGADLGGAKLKNADLSDAILTDAFLGGAVLTGAKLDGADFAGACLTNVSLENVDATKAKNLDVRPPRPAGPNLKKLAGVVKKSKGFDTTIELALGKHESVVLRLTKRTHGKRSSIDADFDHHVPGNRRSMDARVAAPAWEQGMLNLTDRWSRGRPKFETITTKAKKCPLKGEELEVLVYAAWCEALGVPVLTGEALAKEQAQIETRRSATRDKLLAELRGGKTGVANWNKRDPKDREKVGSLRDLDFSDEKMAGVDLTGLDLRGTKFDSASLRKAVIWNCQLQKASFAKANLDGADVSFCKCQETSFEGASLVGAEVRTNCQKANFRNANLTKADFTDADVCGADFTGATLDKADFEGAKFDQDTKFPDGVALPAKMVWKGIGSRPGLTAVAAAAPGTMDFDTFFKNLDAKVEAGRMKKATSMLKAERFSLFADVSDASLVGVVKSQTNPDLVYSCRLAADGRFGCGTQNLKPCGGLQGALCKHLLVLVVGLARAGKIDPATAYAWADASAAHQPALDKDALSETFLKYKGAEAGEIDWRPTETIPEDFYAM